MTHGEPAPPNTYADRIIAGDLAALDERALEGFLAGAGDTSDLMAAADRVRRQRFGDEVHLCSIVNAKQGGCPEDCGFCSQSRHASTTVGPERFIAPHEAVHASHKAQTQGASALGLVTATRGLADDSRALSQMVEGIRAVREAGHTEAHASFGFVSEPALRELAEAGLTELNHNLETGRSYFDQIVTTHTYDERIATIRAAKRVGLRTCCGGIMGMGETPRHRAELAMQLRELDVDEVPINFLVSIEGTRLERVEPLEPLDMLRIVASYRLALPRQNIFIAAGRHHLGHLQPLVFSAGASGLMVGDFLTTDNRSVQDDLDMIKQLGLRPRNCGAPKAETKGGRQRLPVVA
ncbi:MAG: biotin synthase BioB [Myxococcales bacterium FL481]|nr:MAG: biotin synthase BioB [Myxococcales bacterium FL481]